MLTYKIHLIRTGSTSASKLKRYVGQNDIPLGDAGEHALYALREECAYPRVERVYTSPLRRCVRTADILYPENELFEVSEFMDMNLGVFEGKTFEELRGNADFARWLDNSFLNTPPGGEQAQDFTLRVTEGLDIVLRSMMDDKIRTAAVVTHGGVIMTLLAAVGLPSVPLHQWAVGNGMGYTLTLSAQMWMRDRKAEVRGVVPMPPEAEYGDDDDFDRDD